ncbi:MAG: DUF4266 domain-containing protein [bacterium]|nr:DUF4266 domain-containing protein [bacterium]
MSGGEGAWTCRRLSVLAFVLLVFCGSGCQTVEFYQKQRINDPAMKFAEDPTATHFRQKVAYSREGSVGGIGTGAGGGCGCY